MELMKNKRRGGHLQERTLIRFYQKTLRNPEQVEDHVALCVRCLDALDEIAIMVTSLNQTSFEPEKTQTAHTQQ